MTQHRLTTRDVDDPSEILASQRYELVRFRAFNVDPQSGASVIAGPPYPVKQIEATGDHLTILHSHGSFPVYDKHGTQRNPWIRVRDGLVLKRDFRRIYFTIGDNAAGSTIGVRSNVLADVVAYASVGPLMDIPPVVPGVRRGFLTAKVPIVQNTGAPFYTDVLAALVASRVSEAGLPRYLTSGIAGGWLIFKNTGSTPVEIWYGSPLLDGTFRPQSGAFLLAVNDTIQLPLNGCIAGLSGSTITESILANATGGAGELRVLLAPQEQDSFFPDVLPHGDLSS